LISAKPYIPINWAKSIDPVTGRPEIVPEARYDRTGGPWRAKPSGYGGHNWQPMSFNPTTGLVYIPAFELASTFIGDPNFKPKPVGMNLGLDVTAAMTSNQALFMANPPKGYLLAWDPVQQKEAWRVPQPSYWNGGVLSTAGNIVVAGNGAGIVNLFAASTGRKLWSFDAQTGVVAAPITFAVNGKQYVTIVVGGPKAVLLGGGSASTSAIKGGQTAAVAPPPKGRVLTFTLGGAAKLPPLEVVEAFIPEAPKQFAGEETIVAGQHLYDTTCMGCHGLNVESDGMFPDLRHSATIGNKDAWRSVVWDGALQAYGMVSFKKNYSPDELEALRAYVISRARVEQNKN
jgi:quinohemoprotein ethanol dehydrogenase